MRTSSLAGFPPGGGTTHIEPFVPQPSVCSPTNRLYAIQRVFNREMESDWTHVMSWMIQMIMPKKKYHNNKNRLHNIIIKWEWWETEQHVFIWGVICKCIVLLYTPSLFFLKCKIKGTKRNLLPQNLLFRLNAHGGVLHNMLYLALVFTPLRPFTFCHGITIDSNLFIGRLGESLHGFQNDSKTKVT